MPELFLAIWAQAAAWLNNITLIESLSISPVAAPVRLAWSVGHVAWTVYMFVVPSCFQQARCFWVLSAGPSNPIIRAILFLAFI